MLFLLSGGAHSAVSSPILCATHYRLFFSLSGALLVTGCKHAPPAKTELPQTPQSEQVVPGTIIVTFASYDLPEVDQKKVVMQGTTGTYTLYCTVKAAGCMIPRPGRSYKLITATTPRKPKIDFVKGFYVEYTNVETVGRVPNDAEWRNGTMEQQLSEAGAYRLDSFQANTP